MWSPQLSPPFWGCSDRPILADFRYVVKLTILNDNPKNNHFTNFLHLKHYINGTNNILVKYLKMGRIFFKMHCRQIQYYQVLGIPAGIVNIMLWLPECRKTINIFVNTSILIDAHTFNIIVNPLETDNIIERVQPAIDMNQ